MDNFSFRFNIFVIDFLSFVHFSHNSAFSPKNYCLTQKKCRPASAKMPSDGGILQELLRNSCRHPFTRPARFPVAQNKTRGRWSSTCPAALFAPFADGFILIVSHALVRRLIERAVRGDAPSGVGGMHDASVADVDGYVAHASAVGIEDQIAGL